MGAQLSLQPPSVAADPGGEGSATLTIRNTGTVVDQFSVAVLGDAAGWAAVEPPTLSLFPNAEGTVTVRFRPPRTSDVAAGAVPYGVRVTAQEDKDFSLVEEGTVQVGGFAGLAARLVPRTSEGKRGAEHRLELTNNGNHRVTANLSAYDPDDQLAFRITPHQIDVDPGRVAQAELALTARKGAPKHGKRHSFQVTVESEGQPVIVDGGFQQKSANLSALLIWVAVAVVAAVLVVMISQQA